MVAIVPAWGPESTLTDKAHTLISNRARWVHGLCCVAQVYLCLQDGAPSVEQHDADDAAAHDHRHQEDHHHTQLRRAGRGHIVWGIGKEILAASVLLDAFEELNMLMQVYPPAWLHMVEERCHMERRRLQLHPHAGLFLSQQQERIRLLRLQSQSLCGLCCPGFSRSSLQMPFYAAPYYRVTFSVLLLHQYQDRDGGKLILRSLSKKLILRLSHSVRLRLSDHIQPCGQMTWICF